MSADWEWRTLESLSERILSGGTPSSSVASYYDGGTIPWVTTGEVNYTRILDTAKKITERAVAESSARLVPEGTVIIAMYGRGTAGRVAIAGVPVTTNQACCNLVVDASLADARFVYYSLKHSFSRLDALANGSVQQNLSVGSLRRFSIRTPDLAEQRAIAGVLGALDDKIDVNRRTSETLESLVRVLFSASCASDGDPADTCTVSTVASLIRDGVEPQREPQRRFTHFSIPAFDAGRQPVQEFGAAILSNKFAVPARSVLLSKLNPVIERVWVPDVSEGEAAVCSTEFLVFVPQDWATRAYLYGLFTSAPFRSALCSTVTGTSNSHQRVRPEDVLGLPVQRPSSEALTRFDAAAAPMLERIQQVRDESRTLAELRDTLLPRLLSGELRIRDAEREVALAT